MWNAPCEYIGAPTDATGALMYSREAKAQGGTPSQVAEVAEEAEEAEVAEVVAAE